MPTIIHLPFYKSGSADSLGILQAVGGLIPTTKVINQCLVPIAPNVNLRGYAWGNHIFVESAELKYFSAWLPGGSSLEDIDEDENTSKPFFRAEVLSNAETKKYSRSVRNPIGWGYHDELVDDDYDADWRSPHYYQASDRKGRRRAPFAYLKIRISADGADPVEGEFKFMQPSTGLAVLDKEGPWVNLTSTFFGLTQTWRENLCVSPEDHHYDRTGLRVLYRHLLGSTCSDSSDAWWERFFEVNPGILHGDDLTGLSSTLKKKEIAPTIERLQKECPLDWKFFQWLQSGVTLNKQKNNSLLSAFLLKVGADFEATLEALRKARNVTALTTSPNHDYEYEFDHDTSGYTYKNLKDWASGRRAICLSLPGAVEKAAEQEEKADWRKRKTNEGQADGLGITSDFPLLRKAVEEGKIPTSIFHQPKGDAVNVEFDLWEKALKQKGWAEVIFSITQTASRRSTYEKDISPYLAFLFRIPKYLEKHTGKKWKVMPKFVESEWDLEMEESKEDQDAKTTVKRRSAFTPVADNETHTLTVPYVAVCVSGVRTQWCYSRFYHLFEEGFTDPESGGIVTKDFEPKLNGRDDYGLMYYTLTGTDTARGYPTFLIIFERLENQTRVHFHRVRPQRVKDGKQTPACKLVEACYQYMAGNIPASDIMAQQGDLIFIKHPNDPLKAGAKATDSQEGTAVEFESHRMESLSEHVALKLFESKAKTPANRLGFLFAPAGLRVIHPEHQDIPFLGEGWYEVRRCRSWEASPKGIWSLTID